MHEKSQADARTLEHVTRTWESLQAVMHHLSLALSSAVPIRILRLLQRGGPEAEDFERVHSYVQGFAERGANLFFPANREGVTADLFEQVVDAVAVLAFCPGGLSIFGEHYQVLEKLDK